LRDELYLRDTPTDEDYLEQQQHAVIQQQEDDLRQMKSSRPLKAGNLSFVILHGINMCD